LRETDLDLSDGDMVVRGGTNAESRRSRTKDQVDGGMNSVTGWSDIVYAVATARDLEEKSKGYL
jgi:hypothetical protein